MSLPLVYNRDGSLAYDGWVHTVPMGVLPNAAAGIDQVLDDEAIDSIYNSIEQDKRRLGNKYPGVYFGVEHHIYDEDKDGSALGWGKEFEKRPDGLWCKPEWTDLGEEAIRNKRFKFTSFVADRRDLEPLEGKKARVLRIDTVGLTNLPNGKELLSPINNREFRRAPGSASVEKTETNKTKNRNMKSIATQLKLSADASEEAVLAEVNKIINRAETAETELPKIKNRVTELETANNALLGEQVDGLMVECGVKDAKLINRLKPMLGTMKNRAERLECLAEFGFKPNTEVKSPTMRNGAGRSLNREDGKTPADRGGSNSDGSDQARAEKVTNRARELQGSTPGRTWDSCWKQAQSEAAK